MNAAELLTTGCGCSQVAVGILYLALSQLVGLKSSTGMPTDELVLKALPSVQMAYWRESPVGGPKSLTSKMFISGCCILKRQRRRLRVKACAPRNFPLGRHETQILFSSIAVLYGSMLQALLMEPDGCCALYILVNCGSRTVFST